MSKINWQVLIPNCRESSIRMGFAFGAILIGLFFVVELIVGHFPTSLNELNYAGEFKMAIVHCIIASYLLASTFYLYYVQQATYRYFVGGWDAYTGCVESFGRVVGNRRFVADERFVQYVEREIR